MTPKKNRDSVRIQVNGRNYSVRVHSVPGFCTSASLRIGSKDFSSKDYPYGFRGNAIEGLLTRVQEVYPGAAVL